MFDRDNMVKIIESCGVSLYDTEVVSEFENRIFRLYITSKEGINLENGFVKYAINPINPTEFQQFGTPTELNPNNELAQSYEEYKKIRSRDKQLIKKYHQTGGQLDDD